MTILLLILAAAIMALAALAGVVLTLVTLPGVWLTLAVALVCQLAFGEPRLFDWWTLAAATGLALAGEIIETASSAVGAARSGGGKSGAVGSVIGAIVGAIVGSFVVPLIGTVVGAVLGAGIGAAAGERGIRGRTWNESIRVGKGAAGARLVAMIVKTGIAGVVGAALVAAVFIR